ncbi:SsgA family sporulation/cell division regulator [Streptomyces ipomoeae]|uniref:SsgA family sporulation/cell division regulator n=1 Tax=Streptomyces ipomoeae TaxID=103232 RepID=A0AAE9B1D5_9ACTN|nr:SsgA family sporulation/cell division regulator [Streptomyces ipomoeae]TQE35120.1 SsgA family sporulation/cell division regulator [Streptomyces ipomoeae]
MRRPTGSGDVLVLPAHGHHPDTLHVVLRNGSGTALIELPVTEVADLLQRTFSLVPAGVESTYLDVDGALTSLLGKSARP